MPTKQEQEYKWQAGAQGDFARFVQGLQQVADRCEKPARVSITDTYLDTKDHELSNQLIALRVRCMQGHYEITIKARTHLKNGLASRREITLPMPKARSVRGAMKQFAKQGGYEGIATSNLRPRFQIKNQRTIYRVQYGACVCEAALDHYVTYAQGHQITRREIELELLKGRADVFAKLTEKLTAASGLPAAKISKVAGAEKWLKQKFSLN